MEFKKLMHCAFAFAVVPVIAYADQYYYTAERGGERGFNREEGSHQQYHSQGQYHTQGQEGQYHHQEGNTYYNRNYNENVNRTYNPTGHPGSYARGYQQGASSSGGAVYYPTPMYSEPPQQPYNTEPPVQQNQPYQYQYQYPN